MTGAIERAEIEVRSIDRSIDRGMVQTGIILVRLDHLTGFDPLEFDELARQISFGLFLMKHIVAEDVMRVFPLSVGHSDIARVIINQGLQTPFQCAGSVEIQCVREQPIRMISGYSDSMADEGLLGQRDSDLYKKTDLKQRLCPWFRIGP